LSKNRYFAVECPIMTLLRLAFRRQTAIPMLALLFASMTSVVLVVARICWTGQFLYTFLIWNLFLAWLPLLFALLASEQYRSGTARGWRFWSLTGAWVLFFPNAPYIFTDLIHLTSRKLPHFWVDLTPILLCALTGFVVGFLSLYLMQSVVRHRFGIIAGWAFIAAMAGLSAVGIYVGRFLRFNSWDVVTKPRELYAGVGSWVTDPFGHPNAAFPVLFAGFLFITYLMLYALTHLRPDPEAVPARVGAQAVKAA
jgi:uncharacterized membrane protein